MNHTSSREFVARVDPSRLRPVSEGGPEKAIPLNDESQLFVDDYLIARRASVHRRLNQPTKMEERILEPEHPWEGQAAVYGCVVREDDEYRLYYRGWIQDRSASCPYTASPICLARGTDGRNFRRDAVPGGVHAGTNIVLDVAHDDFNILRDDSDRDPGRRYKLLAFVYGQDSAGGLTPAWSADGLRWTWGPFGAIRNFGDRLSYWYDPVGRKHIAWSRDWSIVPSRVIMESQSDDFNSWSVEPRLAVQMDRHDHPGTQFYSGYAFWYRSMYLGYLEMYYTHLQRLDTQLIASRDGRTWSRLCDREIFLPNGPHGDFDAYWAVPTYNPPIFAGGRLLIHYNGRPDPHRDAGFHHVKPGMGGAFALAELREDGFVSLDATGDEGLVETKLLAPPADTRRLEVNACPFNRRVGYAPMRLTVEVVTPDGKTLHAYEISPPGDPDITWHVCPADGPFPQAVRLRFGAHNCRLYSFRWCRG